MDKAIKTKNYNFITTLIKSVFASLCVSLVLILAFALVIKFVAIEDITIKIVNQIIKFVSLIYGMIVLTKNDRSQLFFKGLLLGLFYGIIAYVVFSMLNGGFSFDITTLNDVIFNGIIGSIVGVIFAVFLNRKTNKVK